MNKLKQKINKMSNKERRVFYTSSVVLFLLILLNIGGLSFAWFSALITGNDTAKSAVVETGTLSIKYTNSNELRGTNVMPGWTETKTFTVENTGTVKATYNINWNNLLNEFTNKEDLVYTITSDNNGGNLTETTLPDSGEHIGIIDSIDIEPGVVQTYTLTVSYKNREADQTSDNNKKLIGKIEVLDIHDTVFLELKGTGNDIYTNLTTKFTDLNTNGLIKLKQPATVQTAETIEYRYSGSNEKVKNYVNFNNETWRIIGFFEVDNGTGKVEKRIKIVKNDRLECKSDQKMNAVFSWDTKVSTINTGQGSNQWGPTGGYPGAGLMQELNNLYYNQRKGICNWGSEKRNCDFSTTGLNTMARNMISNAKWYTGGYNGNNILATQAYINERSNTVGKADVGQNITKTSNWTGKIALAYTSDHFYSAKECYKSKLLIEHEDEICLDSNWLYNPRTIIVEWLITPHIAFNSCVKTISTYYFSYDTYGTSEVRPTLYLAPTVKIISGTGTSTEPYELSL